LRDPAPLCSQDREELEYLVNRLSFHQTTQPDYPEKDLHLPVLCKVGPQSVYERTVVARLRSTSCTKCGSVVYMAVGNRKRITTATPVTLNFEATDDEKLQTTLPQQRQCVNVVEVPASCPSNNNCKPIPANPPSTHGAHADRVRDDDTPSALVLHHSPCHARQAALKRQRLNPQVTRPH
jgi:hypothetical protein